MTRNDIEKKIKALLEKKIDSDKICEYQQKLDDLKKLWFYASN